MPLACISECSRYLGLSTSRNLNLHFECPGGDFDLFCHLRIARLGRSPEDAYAGEPGNDLLLKLELFSA